MLPWILAAVLGAFGSLGFLTWRALNRLPDSRPQLAPPKRQDETVVLCLGDSLTAGSLSYDWVTKLQAQLAPDRVRLVNAGINGDLVWNALRRLPEALALRPDVVVIALGVNDVLAEHFPARGERKVRTKNLPQSPSRAFFRDSYRALLDQVLATGARVAVVTPPMLGEDVGAPIHDRLLAYVDDIESMAQARSIPVLRLHARMEDALSRSHRARRTEMAPTDLDFLRVAFWYGVAGKPLDWISARQGWWLTPDGVHLNERGGQELLRLVRAWLRPE